MAWKDLQNSVPQVQDFGIISTFFFAPPIHVHPSLPSIRRKRSEFWSWQRLLLISAFVLLGDLLLLASEVLQAPRSPPGVEQWKVAGPPQFPVEVLAEPWPCMMPFSRAEHDDKSQRLSAFICHLCLFGKGIPGMTRGHVSQSHRASFLFSLDTCTYSALSKRSQACLDSGAK